MNTKAHNHNQNVSPLEKSFLTILVLLLIGFAIFFFWPLNSQTNQDIITNSSKNKDERTIFSKDWIDENSQHYQKISLN